MNAKVAETGTSKVGAQRILKASEMGAIVGFLILFVIFSIVAEGFLSLETFFSIFTVASELGIVAIGISFLMIAGEFDLSVGSVFAVSAMILALSLKHGIPASIGVVLALASAAGIGFLNGAITLRMGIPSFITTLGSMMFWRGLLLAVTGGFPVMAPATSPVLKAIGAEITSTGLRASGLWFIGLMLLFQLVLTKTAYGNHVYATGGNPEAARAMGVNTHRVKLINFVLCSMLAAFGGFVSFARFKIVDPTLGMGMELEAIASAVIGGTLLSGGYGSILGTFIGAFLIGMVRVGLVQAGAPAYWYRAFIGIILIIAAIINTRIRKMVVG